MRRGVVAAALRDVGLVCTREETRGEAAASFVRSFVRRASKRSIASDRGQTDKQRPSSVRVS